MAKRRRASLSSPSTHYVGLETRDAPVIASGWRDPSPPPLTFRISPLPRSGRSLLLIEDRRTFHPDPYRPALTSRRWRHRLRVGLPLNAMGAQRPRQPPRSGLRLMPGLGARKLPVHVGFRGAPHVMVCVRRTRRREALFAAGRAGRGRRNRRPRWSAYSSVSCRR